MGKITFYGLVGLAVLIGALAAAKAQNWCETIIVNNNGRQQICTVCYQNGGSTRVVNCTGG
jgi:hypothetical protein